MNHQQKNVLTRPWFLYLLPLFFVLHVLAENYGAHLGETALIVFIQYTVVAIVFSFLFQFFYKDKLKANLFAFALLAFNFFFGSLHDALKKQFDSSFITKYSVLIPAVVVLFIAQFLYLKKTKQSFFKTARFLNLLFLLFIFIDLVTIAFRAINMSHAATDISSQFTMPVANKPDVYLIVADEYAGKQELKDIFSFENSSFENELGKRGFYVLQNTRSNYNTTVYSISSLFNMDYLKGIHSTISQREMFICRGIINQNNTTGFFKNNGYSIYNHSFFELGGKEQAVFIPFFIRKKDLFTSQTFARRIRTDLAFNIASQQQVKKIELDNTGKNQKLDSLLRRTVLEKTSRPKFVYTHFFMPHYPYYADSNGKNISLKEMKPSEDKAAYLNYLVYVIMKLLQLADYIKANSSLPPIIIIISDHGFRSLSEQEDQKYYFMNLDAVYFPDQNYSQFYDGMSLVNQFRVILNSEFGQKLPLLKDSSIFLRE